MARRGGIDRRRVLQGSALLGGVIGVQGCASARGPLGSAPPPEAPAPPYQALAPIRARADRVFDLTVCLRPFRAAGPRLDAETLGDTLVAHNYGHGGSGWSLSWGSSTLAVQKAMTLGPQAVAVIGCGALGLTSAILAQRAGARVTIYARDLLPQTRSARATGSWTPDSRIALSNVAAPGFAALWEQMARTSFKTYRNYLGLPGAPVEWVDYYMQRARDDAEPQPLPGAPTSEPAPLAFASYRDRIADLTPRPEPAPRGATPFDLPNLTRSEVMMFNIADYGHTLLSDFLLAGGRIQRLELHAPGEIAALPEKVVINCPGYGARALWRDESVTPVRGQIGWLIPQPEVRYGLYYDEVGVLPRRDGFVVQALDGGDMKGYGNTDETADRSETDRAVAKIAALYAQHWRPRPNIDV